MADIKQKHKSNVKIKKLDRNKVYTEKLKDNLMQLKRKNNTEKQEQGETPNEYSINKITDKAKKTENIGIRKANQYGYKAVRKTRNNIKMVKNRLEQKRINKNIREQLSKNIKRKETNMIKEMSKKTTKISEKAIKNTPKAIKQTEEITEKTTKTAIKGTKKAFQIAKQVAKRTVKTIKAGIKATITGIKAIIKGTKALITALIAGGWIAVVIILFVCLIAMLCSSVLGIFFSSEQGVGEYTMSSVVSDINKEFVNKINEIQNNNTHDDYEINSNRAEWKDILSVYAVIVTKGEEQSDVMLLDENKVNLLREIFWQMNIITYRTEEVEKEIEITDESGNTKMEKVKRTVLYIDIENKTINEMIEIYNINDKQKEQLAELQKEEYNELWANVIYGTTMGSSNIVQVAISQVGNVGGQPYWSWYGFSNRVEWCAIFVSWCANQCGYIESGIIPKFSNCQNEGISWFKVCGLWKDKNHTAQAGDIIFFDWENDGHSDHVGIVEKVENGTVYTIEGNSSGDTCRQCEYAVNNGVILGYGTPMY